MGSGPPPSEAMGPSAYADEFFQVEPSARLGTPGESKGLAGAGSCRLCGVIKDVDGLPAPLPERSALGQTDKYDKRRSAEARSLAERSELGHDRCAGRHASRWSADRDDRTG